MEKHLDFTIDFETCALSANAAVMQVAVVPWLRDAKTDPFFNERDAEPYVGYVDLRTCVVDGFDFEPATLKWWSEQEMTAKKAVTDGLPEPITDVLIGILDYIRDFVARYQLESICLWSQGPDMDIAILKNLCRKYDINLEEIVPHASFRDCRTMILEIAFVCSSDNDILTDPSKAYAVYEPLPDCCAHNGASHDALYDAVRSSWYTWQALRWYK